MRRVILMLLCITSAFLHAAEEDEFFDAQETLSTSDFATETTHLSPEPMTQEESLWKAYKKLDGTHCVTFSPDHVVVAFRSDIDDKNLEEYDYIRKESVRVISHSSAITAINYDLETRSLYVGMENGNLTHHVTNVDSHTSHTIEGKEKIMAIASAKIFSFAAITNQGTFIHRHQKEPLTLHRDEKKVSLTSIAMSTDELYCITGSADGTITRYWLILGKIAGRNFFKGHSSPVNSVALDSKKELIASGSADTTIKLWPLKEISTKVPTTEKDCITTLTGHSGQVNSVAFHPKEFWLASGSDDNTIKIWDYRSFRCLSTLTEHTGPVTSVGFSFGYDVMVSASNDKKVILWTTDIPAFNKRDRTLWKNI